MPNAKTVAQTLASILAMSIIATGCLCSEESTDEARLKKQIDTTSVHLYIAVKVALVSTGNDPELKRLKELAMKVVTDSAGQPGADGNTGAKIGVGDLIEGGKALWKLKKIGQEIAQGDQSENLEPVLPLLLKKFGASPGLVAAFDANTEHAFFFAVTSILKANEKSPIPIPIEIVLYEAWHTDPDSVKIPGAAGPLHSMKAWTYGNNDYCDLAASEAEAAEASGFSPSAARQGLSLILDSPEAANIISDQYFKEIDAGIKGLAHGGVAICHLRRGDKKSARPFMKRFLEHVRNAGVVGEKLDLLEVIIDCGGDEAEVKRGLARLAQLEARSSAPTEELQLVRAYCEASDETSFELARKLSLGGKLLEVGLDAAKKSGTADKLEQSKAFRTAASFATTCQQLATGTSDVKEALDDLSGSAKGLLEKIRQD